MESQVAYACRCGYPVDLSTLSGLTADDLQIGMRVLLVDGPWHTCHDKRVLDVAHHYGHVTNINPFAKRAERFGHIWHPCVYVEWKGRDGGPLSANMAEIAMLHRPYSPDELYVLD